jgi:NAD(P)-dependent dehydrogenase (short-subunit alcohol dehydrogenase family)
MISASSVAIITGASQGIGASLVKGFRAIGYDIVANSRSIRQYAIADDAHIAAVEGDISRPEIADDIVGTALERFGRIDTLVNNAGLFIPKPFTEYSETEFTAMMAVNVGGFFHLTQRVADWMLRKGSGHIVNIASSLVAEQPVHGLPAALTALTKGGMIAASRALAIEFADRGIRVNVVAPGATNTAMHAPENHAFLAGLHPTGRMAEPQEIVDAVLYLEGAKCVTGEVLHVDGGAHAGR